MIYANGKNYTLWNGNSKEVLLKFADDSFDSVVCDPPYELGFMGKKWDKSGIAFDVELWKQVLRVLKPGGHLIAFSGSRTYHRMAVAIEDAGFEIRDQILWLYGNGFPKSLNVSKAIDKNQVEKPEIVGSRPKHKLKSGIVNCGDPVELNNIDITIPKTDNDKKWEGWGTQLKPSHEPMVLARKPLACGNVAENVLEFGTGGLNIDGCRIDADDDYHSLNVIQGGDSFSISDMGNGKKSRNNLFIPASGRFPANLIHDGSDEVNSVLGNASRYFYNSKCSKRDRNEGLDDFKEKVVSDRNPDAPSANVPNNRTSSAKKNHHPTVKPTDLMAYLCRLITPPNGKVLDPFMGSGSTGKACMREGFEFVGIDLNAEYCEISKARIDFMLNNKNQEKTNKSSKKKQKQEKNQENEKNSQMGLDFE